MGGGIVRAQIGLDFRKANAHPSVRDDAAKELRGYDISSAGEINH